MEKSLGNFQACIRPDTDKTLIYVKLTNEDKIFGAGHIFGEVCYKILIVSYTHKLFVINSSGHGYLYQIDNKSGRLIFVKQLDRPIHDTLPLLGYGFTRWRAYGDSNRNMCNLGLRSFANSNNEITICCYSFCTIQGDKIFVVDKTGISLQTVVDDKSTFNKVLIRKDFDYDGYKDFLTLIPVTCCKISNDLVMIAYQYYGDKSLSEFKDNLIKVPNPGKDIDGNINMTKVKIINVNTLELLCEYYFTAHCRYEYYQDRSVLEFFAGGQCWQFYFNKTSLTFTQVTSTFCTQDTENNFSVIFPISRLQINKEMLCHNVLGDLFASLPRVIIEIIIEYVVLLY